MRSLVLKGLSLVLANTTGVTPRTLAPRQRLLSGKTGSKQLA